MNQEFLTRQRILGLAYGLAAGLAFSILCWGVDAITLFTANGTFPWLKVLPGLIISLISGGLVGWLTTRTENHLLAVFAWLGLAALFSWLTIWMQISATPYLLRLLSPALRNYLEYPSLNGESQYWLIGFLIMGLAAVICGLLEINLIKNALLSSSGISSLTPFFLVLILFSVAGSGMDYMINTHFRQPVVVLNDLIDFAYQNKDVEVPVKVAREKHLSAVKDFIDLMDRERKLTVVAYDREMGQMDVMVDFHGLWVRCTVIYNQPVFCKQISTIPGLIDVDETHLPVIFRGTGPETQGLNLGNSTTFVILK
jgi:hypothetical protein